MFLSIAWILNLQEEDKRCLIGREKSQNNIQVYKGNQSVSRRQLKTSLTKYKYKYNYKYNYKHKGHDKRNRGGQTGTINKLEPFDDHLTHLELFPLYIV